jgi:hypothetical protein
MKLAKYGDDVKAYTVSTDRQTQRRVTCDFVATGSGSYFSRSCMNLAQWAEGYFDAKGEAILPSSGNYVALRCHRHRAIDERTQFNRGWGTNRAYLPWDGATKAADMDRQAASLAEAQRLDAVNAKVIEAAKYLLAHAEVATDERQMLKHIVTDAQGNLLVVR